MVITNYQSKHLNDKEQRRFRFEFQLLNFRDCLIYKRTQKFRSLLCNR